jgi:hypothetical protein
MVLGVIRNGSGLRGGSGQDGREVGYAARMLPLLTGYVRAGRQPARPAEIMGHWRQI